MVLYIDTKKRGSWFRRCGVLVIAAAFIVLLIFGLSQAETVKQRTFASPEEAVKVMIEALKSNDVKAMEEILGPGSKDLISSGDPVADQSLREQFVKQYEEKNRLEQNPDKAVLSIGNDDWPCPIPVVKKGGLWRFDAEEGLEEMLAGGSGKMDGVPSSSAWPTWMRSGNMRSRTETVTAFWSMPRNWEATKGRRTACSGK